MGERAQIEKVLPDTKAGAPASGGVDEQGRKARQMFGAGLDGVDPAPLPLVEVGRRQEVADRENAGQRRAHLMRKGRERRLDNAGSNRFAGGFLGGSLFGGSFARLTGCNTCSTLLRQSFFRPPLTAPWART